MAYSIGDIFIGQFPTLQSFGAKPETYSARYPIRGHNGVDFATPSMTPILAAADGIISEIGFDSGGYGKYIKIIHNEYLTLYGHLNDFVVSKDDKVIAGGLIAHSNNTGFSDTPHLHFGIAPCDSNGNKTQKDNGYAGYIDPMGTECLWAIKGLTQPVVPVIAETAPPIAVDAQELSTKGTQANSFLTVLGYLNNHFPNQISAIDPIDPNAGKYINELLAALLLQIKNSTSSPSLDNATSEITSIEQAISPYLTPEKLGLYSRIWNTCKGFIFAQR